MQNPNVIINQVAQQEVKSINKAIKNIIKALAFIFIFGFLFIHVSYALRHSNDELEILRTYRMQSKNSIDVLFFGDCRVNRFWMPMEAWEQHGFTSYNYSNGSMPPSVIKYCVTEALKKQSPELIIIEVSSFENYVADEENENRESQFRRFSDTMPYSINRFLMIENCAPKISEKESGKLNYHFDIAQYHTNLTALVDENHWKYAFNRAYDDDKTFGGFITSMAYKALKRRNVNITEEMPLPDNLDVIYRDLIDYCMKLDADVIFVLSPIFSRESEEGYKKCNYMNRVASENQIAFIDFNSNDIFVQTGLDVETDYYDKDHVNIFGAKKYTKWFGEYLKDNFDLPDKRGDEKYSDWDIAYERWIIEVSETEKGVFALMPENIQGKINGIGGVE